MSNPISENLTWRPINELPEAYPDPDHDIWVLLWSPDNGPAAQLLYGKDTGDLAKAGCWTYWAALKGPTRPAHDALVADFGEEAVRAALEGWDGDDGATDTELLSA